MRIAVLVPCYNSERFLPACLDSILAQDGVELEVFAGDDGSRDGTAAILEDYSRRDPRVHFSVHENSGVSENLNRLLDSLPNDVEAFGFVDSDDFIHPGMFSELSGAMMRTGAQVAECRIVHVPSGARASEVFSEPLNRVAEAVVDDMSVYWLRRTAPNGWINKNNKLFLRSAVKDIRFRRGLAFEEDYFYACEVHAAVSKKVLLGFDGYAYRANPASATGNLNCERYFDSAAERVRLSCEVFLNSGRVPAALEPEFRRELSKDAYRMLIRKNLKKNGDGESRRRLFLAAGECFARLEREYGFAPIGLSPLQRLLHLCCLGGRYRAAGLLACLT